MSKKVLQNVVNVNLLKAVYDKEADLLWLFAPELRNCMCNMIMFMVVTEHIIQPNIVLFTFGVWLAKQTMWACLHICFNYTDFILLCTSKILLDTWLRYYWKLNLVFVVCIVDSLSIYTIYIYFLWLLLYNNPRSIYPF